jgi:periplasmic copper chaperone A
VARRSISIEVSIFYTKEFFMTSNTIKLIAACAIFYWANGTIYAQTVKIEGAWVRTTVQGQMGTGGFMKLTADQDMKLISVTSPVAGIGEVHEMRMDGGVMKMRALPNGLDLPAGKAVELKPGGFHVMLMDLKQALPKDTTIPVTLMFKDKAGKDVKMDIKVPVATRAPGDGAASNGHDMHKH